MDVLNLSEISEFFKLVRPIAMIYTKTYLNKEHVKQQQGTNMVNLW